MKIMRHIACLSALLSGGALVAAEPSPIVPFVIPAGRPSEAECRELVKGLAEAGFDQMLVYPSTGLDYEYLGEGPFPTELLDADGETLRQRGGEFDAAHQHLMRFLDGVATARP